MSRRITIGRLAMAVAMHGQAWTAQPSKPLSTQFPVDRRT